MLAVKIVATYLSFKLGPRSQHSYGCCCGLNSTLLCILASTIRLVHWPGMQDGDTSVVVVKAMARAPRNHSVREHHAGVNLKMVEFAEQVMVS